MRHVAAGAALVAQRQPLMHAEAMLFVDDGQREIAERHAFLHQRMRADDQLCRAAGDLRKHRLARLAGDLAGQPDHAHAQRFQPAAQIREMLFGQQFGRCHQCDLMTLFDRQHRRHRRDHGLAAADIALHQPQHRHRFGEIVADLDEHALLRLGQGERQRLAQFGHAFTAAQRGRGVRLHRDALPAQAQVMGEQLFQRESALRRMRARQQRLQIAALRRTMQRHQGVAQRRQAGAQGLARQHLGRQEFKRAVVRQTLQCLGDQLAQHCRADAFDGGIDRIQPVAECKLVGGAEHPITRMHDLQALLAGARRAVHAHPRAVRELRDLLRTEMEKTQHQRRIGTVADGDAQHRPAAETPLDRFDSAFDLRRQTRLQHADRREFGAVLVLPRQMKPQILQGHEATRGQLFGNDLTNAAEPGQRLRGDVINRVAAGHAR